MATIAQAFDTAAGAAPSAKLVMTGPGVFSVTSRNAIKDQVSRLSLIGVALIATLLLLVYRSFTALALGLLPVVERRVGRHRRGQPGLRVGARHHPGVRHRADRRGGGLFHLPVRAIGTAGRRPADLDQALLAHRPPGRPDLRLRLCVAAAVRLSRPRATGPVCHCRPGRGRRRDAFRAAASAAVEIPYPRRVGHRRCLVALGRTRRRAALAGRAGVAGGLRHPGPEPFPSVEPEYFVTEPGVASRRRARHPPARRHGRARCALPGGGVRCEPGGRTAILRASCRAAANASRSR